MRTVKGWPARAGAAAAGVAAAAALVAGAGSAGATPALKPPLVLIQRTATGIVFVPAKVRDPVVTGADCSDSDYSIMIQNQTNRTLTITFQGEPFNVLTPAEEVTSCQEGAGRFVFKLQGHPHAKLVVKAVVPGS